MPPISPQLHEELGKRLRKSREDVLATVRARTDGDTDDRPAISPNAHMQGMHHARIPKTRDQDAARDGGDQFLARFISRGEEQIARHRTLHIGRRQ